MRIVGGKNRSRIIKMVPSDDTRETSDKVRQAVFNTLDNDIIDAQVLDLFAGSGAYGLEALSRGAKFCTFNDAKPLAIKIIKENISTLKEESNTLVIQKDYNDAIDKIIRESMKLDIIFLDPPYKLDIYEDVMNRLIPALNEGAIIVAEMIKERVIELERIPEFEFSKERIYGTKKINYFIKK
ncbi:16S rRNA (guanine(966)-N(2))-methyltransferase RsmD [Acholeplasma hippikon]|uniref:Methyltransferase n=1 Tax=Acholeplasma hippikon TaxID=264636 RepID=A0A449BIS9_9MOLU|nr:16S rRNA (guanine(966)-N(2))-methyltransferase RsmD [Acholeplasma hippikon]VEU82365.1 Putative methyltransferase [Acholeplasma hippikon]